MCGVCPEEAGERCVPVPFLTRSLPFFSISAVQWLCNADKKSDVPAKRLYCFFSSLYSVLVSVSSHLGWLPSPALSPGGVRK